jgi:hypothetical protein
MSSAQSLLTQLAKGSYSSKEEGQSMLLELAKAFWHKGVSLDFSGFSVGELRRAGYTLALLCGFYDNLPATQRVEANRLLQSAFEVVQSSNQGLGETYYPDDEPSSRNVDDVAVRWGLSRGAQPRKVPGFLDAQRRSFKAA